MNTWIPDRAAGASGMTVIAVNQTTELHVCFSATTVIAAWDHSCRQSGARAPGDHPEKSGWRKVTPGLVSGKNGSLNGVRGERIF
jgi:hypothetical protein